MRLGSNLEKNDKPPIEETIPNMAWKSDNLASTNKVNKTMGISVMAGASATFIFLDFK